MFAYALGFNQSHCYDPMARTRDLLKATVITSALTLAIGRSDQNTFLRPLLKLWPEMALQSHTYQLGDNECSTSKRQLHMATYLLQPEDLS